MDMIASCCAPALGRERARQWEEEERQVRQAIARLVCPECGARLMAAGGCLECPSCGWAACA